MEASSDIEQKLTTFISQLLSGVVESVCQQGYQVAFLASKFGDGSNDILSLHGGLSLSIQEQLEVNFMSLIKESSEEVDYDIRQSPEETIQSTHTVSIPITDNLTAVSSHDDLTFNRRTVLESAAHPIEVESTSEFDANLHEYIPTDDTELSQTADDDANEPVEYNDGERLDVSQNQELQIKPEPPMDLEIEHDEPQTWSNSVPVPIFEPLGGKKKYKSKLIYRLPKDTGEKRYACTECPYRTTRISSLKTHILTHADQKPFACPECPYRAAQRSHLNYHMQTHTGEKPFACPECPHRSVRQADLKSHMMTHTGEKPFACPECPYRSRMYTNLKTHIMLKHTGEKPFACPECPHRSVRQADLKSHMMTHTGEKPFGCPECPYRSTSQAQLKNHILTHTGEKPFACLECPFRCRHLSSMKRHMLRHTGEKPISVP